MTRILAILLLILVARPIYAIYDPLSVPNNRFGIHILDPNEIEKAAELVNSSGGDWGYVTIPIQANNRDLEKWTRFMEKARDKKIIPILRIASYPAGSGWAAPNEYDLVDFATFLNQLHWPVKNRYVVVYNEPNHQGEWGGFVYPIEYARVLDRAIDIFHVQNEAFFIIGAGMDAAAPNSELSMEEYSYFREMNKAVPGIFSRLDGLSSHAYGNPGFESRPDIYSRRNVASYRFEQDFLCRNFRACNLKIFITEAGWQENAIGELAMKNYYNQALSNIWVDNNIVAITPFLFDAQSGPFAGFSFTGENGRLRGFAEEIKRLPKTTGQPILSESRVAIKDVPKSDVFFKPNFFINLYDRLSSFLTQFLL